MVEETLIALLNDASSKASSGDLLGALHGYTKATEMDHSSATAWYGLGVVHAKRGDTDMAIPAFERAHDIEPSHGPTTANLAVLLENIDTTRASKFARIAIKSVGEVPELLRIASLVDDEHEDVNEEPPLLESIPIEKEIVDDEPLMLSASPVLTPIDEVVLKAESLLRTQSPSESLKLIQPRLEGDQCNNPALWSLCGVSLAQLGHDQEAIEAFEYAIRIGHDEAKTHYNLAQLLRKSDQIGKAKQSLANALLCDPGHINSLVARGELFADEGDNESALQHWNSVVAIEPDHPISERLVLHDAEISDQESTETEVAPIDDGSDFEDMNDQVEFESSAEQSRSQEVVKTIEDNADTEIDITDTKGFRITLARKLTESGDAMGAVNAWKDVLEEDKQSPEVWNGLADALSIAGHIERAQQCRQRADFLLSQENNDQIEAEQVAEIDLIQAAAEAQEKMTELPAHDEESVNVCIEWYNRGLALLSEENGIEALNCFEKAIGGAPREEIELRVRSHNGRGHALYQLGRYAESIQAYHAAISMDPASVSGRALYNMGSSYANVEHYADAIKCFEQALQRGLDTDDTELCKTQINRCRLLSKEQNKRRNQAA
mgnify:CR=1 FL=1